MPRMQKVRPRLGFIFIGLGKQGRASLRLLSEVRGMLKNSIDIVLAECVDPNDENFRLAERECHASFSGDTRRADTLRDALNRMTEEGRHKRYTAAIVYDASSTERHLEHLMEVHRHRTFMDSNGYVPSHYFHYFGEKPIASFSEEQLSKADPAIAVGLQNIAHYCHFTELRNPAFRALKRDLISLSADVQEVQLWRTSCVAIEHYVLKHRSGVTGGAFMDKSIHDLSIYCALIDNASPSVGRKRKHVVKDATADYFLPHKVLAEYRERHIAKSLAGGMRDESARLPPAEGTATARVESRGGKCQGRFYTSWIGIPEEWERTINQLAERFEIRRPNLVWRTAESPDDFQPGFAIDEARIGYVRSVAKDSVPTEYFFNLLTRPPIKRVSRTAFHPWVVRRRLNEVLWLDVDREDAISASFRDVCVDVSNRASGQRAKRQSCDLATVSAGAHMIASDVRERIRASYHGDNLLVQLDKTRAEILKRIVLAQRSPLD